MGILTFTTDFGTKDGNVGVMKGVALGIAPELQIVDLTHQIAPQNIRLAAFVLNRQIFYFPAGTVHVVVVDPGVGTSRRPIAARVGDQLLVGPDNGVFSPLYQRAETQGWLLEIVDLTASPQYWRDQISHVFHGRDIFSPVGAHLAAGVPIEDLGEVIDDPIRFELPQPTIGENEAEGEVILLYEHLGNIISNIHKSQLPEITDYSKVEVTLGDTVITDFVRTFGEREPGSLVSLFGSTYLVIVSVVNGDAIKLLKPKLGDKVKIKWG